MENQIEKKIKELLNLTSKFLFVEHYSHTGEDMWKIYNEYTKFRSDKIVLCSVNEGFEKALDLAIAFIKVKKSNYQFEEN